MIALPAIVFAQNYTAPTGEPPYNNTTGPVWLTPSAYQSGDIKLGTSNGDLRMNYSSGQDIFMYPGTAIRVDSSSAVSSLNIGNYGSNGDFNLNVRGDLFVNGDDGAGLGSVVVNQICLNSTGSASTNCRSSWPAMNVTDVWVDTTGDTMTGQLTVDRSSGNGVDVSAPGIAGRFTESDQITYPTYVDLGSSGRGIVAYGIDYAGYFEDTNNAGNYVWLANDTRGIDAYGTGYGGRFYNTTAGSENTRAELATTGYGVVAYGNTAGGVFVDLNNAEDSRAYVGNGDRGIYALSDGYGGQFYDRVEGSRAYTAYGTTGLRAYGTGTGGDFYDLDNPTSRAYLGSGNRGGYLSGTTYGIVAVGDSMGGRFYSNNGASTTVDLANGTHSIVTTDSIDAGGPIYMNNNSLLEVNTVTINDTGLNEGLRWNGTSNGIYSANSTDDGTGDYLWIKADPQIRASAPGGMRVYSTNASANGLYVDASAGGTSTGLNITGSQTSAVFYRTDSTNRVYLGTADYSGWFGGDVRMDGRVTVNKSSGGQPTMIVKDTSANPNLALVNATEGMRFEYHTTEQELRVQSSDPDGTFGGTTAAVFQLNGQSSFGSTSPPGNDRVYIESGSGFANGLQADGSNTGVVGTGDVAGGYFYNNANGTRATIAGLGNNAGLFINPDAGTQFHAAISGYSAQFVGNLNVNDYELRNVRALQLTDWDDDTGGTDSKYRLLARDGAWMFYNGGVIVGSYGNDTWTDVGDGDLIVESDFTVGYATKDFEVLANGNVRMNNNTALSGSNIFFANASTGNIFMDVGSLYTQGGYKPGGGSWDTWSDGRLKDLKGGFDRGLDAITELSPVYYSYKSDNIRGFNSEKTYIGLIAQDVEKVIPEAVETDEDGYLTLDNDPIIWTMLNAIKELKAENDALKAQQEDILKRLEALEQE